MKTVVVALLALAACSDRWQKCKANGGRVETYDCHTVTGLIAIPTGKTVVVVPTSHTSCSSRCVGANAEAQP